MVHTYVQQKPIRNTTFVPDLSEEGTFTKTLPEPIGAKSDAVWHEDLTPFERCFYHQTLNSTRRFAGFIPSPLIPKDSLEFILQSRYNHNLELFGDKVDTLLQKESVGEPSFRRIRNTVDQKPLKVEHMGHPLRVGGLTEKISPHSVKLINSGHHSQMTNPGYSRQPADGNKFNY